MLYMHEQNLLKKIKDNYRNVGDKIKNFYYNSYLNMRIQIKGLNFNSGDLSAFEKATEIFNDYYSQLLDFSRKYNISPQSKFESTFLEEISVYLFEDLDEIKNEIYHIFNKGIYAGLKIDTSNKIEIIKKDVDFCIGKKANVVIDNQPPITLILPIIAVEVKTYLDATMFGEVKSSSKSIRSASPSSKTYVLIGYKALADEHIISARQDSTLTEIFALKASECDPMHSGTLYEYWKEITDSIKNATYNNQILVPGRLLKK